MSIQLGPKEPLQCGPGAAIIAQSVMKTIRVALMGMRPRLRDILTDAIARERDMELIDYQIRDEQAILADRPDVMVCESDNPLDLGLPTRLLRTVPLGRVLLVGASGDHAALYELRPLRTVMRTVGIDEVIAAIRFGLQAVPDASAPSAGRRGES